MRRPTDLRRARTKNAVYLLCLCASCLLWSATSGQLVDDLGERTRRNSIRVPNTTVTQPDRSCFLVTEQEIVQIRRLYERFCPNYLHSVLEYGGESFRGVFFPNAFGDTTLVQALGRSESINASNLHRKLLHLADQLPHVLNVNSISFGGRFNQSLCIGIVRPCQQISVVPASTPSPGNLSFPLSACKGVCQDMAGLSALSTWSQFNGAGHDVHHNITHLLLRLSSAGVCDPANSSRSCMDCGLPALHSSSACRVMEWSHGSKAQMDNTSGALCPVKKCSSLLVATDHSSRVPQLVQKTATHISELRSILVDEPISSNLLSCGLPCNFSIFSPDSDVGSSRGLVAVLSGIALSISSLACINFAANYDAMSRFPTRIVMYVNTCSVLLNLTVFLSSLLSWSGMTSTMCYQDGLLRVDVPRLDSHQVDISSVCVGSAMLLAFLTFATGGWWIALIHGWYKTSQSLDNLYLMAGLPRLEIIYNVAVWLTSALVTAAFTSTGKISAVPTAGMCFSENAAVVVIFFGLPTIVLTSFTAPMMYIGHHRLKEIWVELEKKGLECGSVMSPRTVAAHQDTLRRLGIYLVVSLVFLCLALFGIILYSVDVPEAETQLIQYLTCLQLSCTPVECAAPHRVPALVHLLLPLLSVILTAFLSGWIFSKAKWVDVKVSARRSVSRLSGQLHSRLALNRTEPSTSLSLTTLPSLDISSNVILNPSRVTIFSPPTTSQLNEVPTTGPDRCGTVKFVRGVINPFAAPILCTTLSPSTEHCEEPVAPTTVTAGSPSLYITDTVIDGAVQPRSVSIQSPISIQRKGEECSDSGILPRTEPINDCGCDVGCTRGKLNPLPPTPENGPTFISSDDECEIFSPEDPHWSSLRKSAPGCLTGEPPSPHVVGSGVSEYFYPHISIENITDPVVRWKVVMDNLRRPGKRKHMVSLSHFAAAVKKSTASFPRKTSLALERLSSSASSSSPLGRSDRGGGRERLNEQPHMPHQRQSCPEIAPPTLGDQLIIPRHHSLNFISTTNITSD